MSVEPRFLGGLGDGEAWLDLQRGAIGVLLDPLPRACHELHPAHGLDQLIDRPGVLGLGLRGGRGDHGCAEGPGDLDGGVTDATREMLKAADDLSKWIGDKTGTQAGGGFGKLAEMVPQFDANQTPGGEIASSIRSETFTARP